MDDNIESNLHLDDLPPDYLLNPARLTAFNRTLLMKTLGLLDVDRLVIERGREYQSLRRNGNEWYLTCRNSRY